jgi:hypothetical protein
MYISFALKYKCIDCGFAWNDVEVKKKESNPFIRFLKSKSRDIKYPQTGKNGRKVMICFLFFVLTELSEQYSVSGFNQEYWEIGEILGSLVW